MPKKKIVDEVLDNAPDIAEVAPVEEETASVEEVSQEKKGDSVSVYDTNGNFIRVYSKEEHGKDFMDLAKGFATQKGYSLK